MPCFIERSSQSAHAGEDGQELKRDDPTVRRNLGSHQNPFVVKALGGII